MSWKLCCVLAMTLAAGRGALAADLPDYPFVFVTGTADTAVHPDIAHCSAMVTARDKDAAKASNAVDERVNAVVAMATANHVAAADIDASATRKQVLTESARDVVAISGYEISREISFTVRDVDASIPIEQSLMTSPNVVNVSCRFDRTDRKSLEAELTTRALQSARDEADRLARPLGRHVTSAAAVSRIPFASIPEALGVGGMATGVYAGPRMFKMSAAASELLVPATISLSASVNVLFKME